MTEQTNYFSINNDAFQQDAVERQETSFSSTWLRFPSRNKPYICRILPPWSVEGVPFRRFCQHDGNLNTVNDQGEPRRVSPICMTFIFHHRAITKYLFDAGKVTRDDYQAWQRAGCPLCEVAKAAVKRPATEDLGKNLMPRPRYFWNILSRDNNSVYKWASSQKFAEQVNMTYEANIAMGINIFDPNQGRDFSMMVTGEGKGKRYSQPIFSQVGTPLGVKDGPHNLDDCLASGVQKFNAIVSILRANNHTNQVIQQFGLQF